MKRIKIDTRHLGDIWRMPCIRKAYKDDDGQTYIIFSDGRRHVRLTDGDAVTYDDKSGQWNVELTTASLRFNGRYPHTTQVRWFFKVVIIVYFWCTFTLSGGQQNFKLLIVFLIVLSLSFWMFMPICERQADTPLSGGDYVRVVTASGKRDGVKIQCRIFQ